MNEARLRLFEASLGRIAQSPQAAARITEPRTSSNRELLLFHTERYVELVKRESKTGDGYLDFPDTPAFPGVFEASLYPVGSTLHGMEAVLSGAYDHFFNPVGGLHHAARDRASGFCVFNDAAIAIASALERGFRRVAYVDIDAHHGDGVFYGFESDPRVIAADIHEDGRTLFPGSGREDETGSGEGAGSKLNLPLRAGSGDAQFLEAFERAYRFVERSRPDFILLQCGADGLAGDPLTHLRYSRTVHAVASKRLHELAHQVCGGRIVAMGGGGYSAENVNAAWLAVIEGLKGNE